MNPQSFSKWNAGKLSLAALGGIVAGSVATTLSGCNSKAAAPAPNAGGPTSAKEPAVAQASLGTDHACAGLNGCAGQGADAKNKCAGQGGCATKAMHHICRTHNDCKGQGGCGEMAGANSCKGQGECAVPIKKDEAWKMAREKLESKMEAVGKKLGPAPSKS